MLTIPSEYIRAARLTESELMTEIAVMLFQKEKLTLGQAARMANTPQFRFQSLLASRDIPIHYGITEYLEDIQTLKSLNI